MRYKLKRVRFQIIHFILLLSISGCGGGGGSVVKTPALPTGNIEGNIYAPVGSEPAGARVAAAATPQPGYIGLADATVTATCGAAQKSAKTQSGANAGYFSINGLPVGTCTLTTTKTGFAESRTTVSVTPNTTTTVGAASGTTMLPATSGSITVTANMQGGEIVIDGKETGIVMFDTSYNLNNISTGNHTVSLKISGFKPVDPKTVTIQQGASTTAELFVQILNEKIYFASDRDSDFVNNIQVGKTYRMNPDGSNQERISPPGLDVPIDYQSSVSADGTKVAYVNVNGDHIAQIFIMNSDGTNRKQITHETYGAVWPTFSYDSKYIVAARETKAQAECLGGVCNELVIYDTNGALIRQLTNNDYNEIEPSFSPDGKHIVFVSARPTIMDYDVYIIDVDGKNEKQLTDANGTGKKNIYPSFSPDGKKIVFKSNYYEPQGFYIMNIDGSSRELLLEHVGGVSDLPHFSPDGKYIAFVGLLNDTNYTEAIFTYKIDDKTTTRLTFGQGISSDYNLSWTP